MKSYHINVFMTFCFCMVLLVGMCLGYELGKDSVVCDEDFIQPRYKPDKLMKRQQGEFLVKFKRDFEDEN